MHFRTVLGRGVSDRGRSHSYFGVTPPISVDALGARRQSRSLSRFGERDSRSHVVSRRVSGSRPKVKLRHCPLPRGWARVGAL